MCVVSTNLTRLYTRCGGAQTSRGQFRSQNDKNKRIVQEGFETPEMNCPQEDRCEHSLTMTSVVCTRSGRPHSEVQRWRKAVRWERRRMSCWYTARLRTTRAGRRSFHC